MQNKFESLELGQFIPLHYHHNMLNDNNLSVGEAYLSTSIGGVVAEMFSNKLDNVDNVSLLSK